MIIPDSSGRMDVPTETSENDAVFTYEIVQFPRS